MGKVSIHKDLIIREFKNNKSCSQIARDINCATSSVIDVLRLYGYNTSRYRSFDPNNLIKHNEEKLFSLYKQGKSTVEIAKILGYSRTSIYKYLKEKGFKLQQNIYEVDLDFFKKIDTEEKSYIYGFILGDGCISKRDGGFIIGLGEQDKEILEKMAKVMNYTGPIRIIKKQKPHQNVAILNINRQKLSQDLIKLNCIPNKTKLVHLPKNDIIPTNLLKHTIRGLFDSDGSIDKQGRIYFDGCYYFINDLKQFFIKRNFKFTNIYEEKNDCRPQNMHNFRLVASRKMDAKKILEFMYKDSKIYLDRKRKLAKDIYGI